MITRRSNGSDALDRLRVARGLLDELLPKLGEVNRAFADVTKPLATVSDLDLEHRRELAARIRAANREWEVVTDQIKHALASLNDCAT